MDSDFKSHLVSLLRLAVTTAAIAWVFLKINWRDQVQLADGTVLRGQVTAEPDRFVVITPGGRIHLVPRDETSGESAFQPGFLTLFKDIRVVYLLMGLVVYPLANVLGAVRWRELMRAHQMDLGFSKSLQLTWLGFFWSLVFPGVTGGDVVKAYCVARTAENRAVAVLIVFLDRIIGLIGLAVLSGVVILFNLHNQELRTVSSGILIFILAMVGGGVLFFSRRLRRWLGLDWLIGLLPFQARVSQLDDALFEYRYHKKTILTALLLSLAAHVANVGTFYLAGKALRLPVAWQHYFVFIPVMLMVAALPISVGGLGVLESGVTHFLTLAAVGASANGALALCLLYRVMTVFIGLPGAMVTTEERAEDRTPQAEIRY